MTASTWFSFSFSPPHFTAHSLPCFFSQLTAQPNTSCTSFPSSVTSPNSPIRFTSGKCSSDTWWPSTCSLRIRWDRGWALSKFKSGIEVTKSIEITEILHRDNIPACSWESFSSCWPERTKLIRGKKWEQKCYLRVYCHILLFHKLPWGASWPRSPPWSCLAMSH